MDNPLFVGKVLHEFEQLASTNSFAQKLLSKSTPPEGTVISTYNQYQGRGQIGSSWESAPGRNLSISVIFYPNFLSPNEQFYFNMAMSLGIRFFLKEILNMEVQIKWPNDIIINEKKIAGILIQNNISLKLLQSSILGVGINVNQQLFNYAPNPTSLSLLCGKFFELNDLREKLFQSLERYYLKLKTLDFNQIQEDYISHLFLYEKEALFQDEHSDQFLGKITGVTPIGRLKINTGREERTFGIKEIQLVR